MLRSFTLLLAAALASGADIPKRIISLSPDVTEMLYGIGAFDRLVGVGNYDTYPPQAAKLPHLGQLHSPNLEQLTALRPDLVIVNSAQAPFLADTMKSLGFRLLITSNKSVQEIYDAMTQLGHATGNEKEAAVLVATTRAGLERIARKMAAKPGLVRPRVALIVDRTPGMLRDMYYCTEGTYLAELISIAGGRMALPAVPTGYAKLRQEDLLAANPDVVLDFIQGAVGRFSGNPIDAWQEMPELKAFRTHRIHEVNEDYVPHASQRIVLTVELFAKLIHPEIP